MKRRCCPQWIRFRHASAIVAALIGIVPHTLCVNRVAAELAKPELVVPGPTDGARFNAPGGIALNPNRGEVILANTKEHRIEIYTLGGRLLTRFTHRVRGKDGNLVDGLPRSVAVAGASRLLVADSYAPYVDVVDYRGRSVGELITSIPPDAGGAASVAVARDGKILVAGSGSHGRIYLFASDFTPIGSWGEAGSQPGHLNGIAAIAELPGGNIAVACMQTELAVQIFTPAGEYVRGFGSHEIGPGNFSLPSGIATTTDGRIWVGDELRQIVQVFDSSGTFLGALGGGGSAPGAFQYPSALATDGATRLAVAERVGGRFQLFTILGRGDDPESERP